jgi:hypothetical protein
MVERIVAMAEAEPTKLNTWIEVAEWIYAKHDEARYQPWWFKKDIDFLALSQQYELPLLLSCAKACGPAFEYALDVYSAGGSAFFTDQFEIQALWKAYAKVVFNHAIGNPERGVRVLRYIQGLVEQAAPSDKEMLFNKLIKHAASFKPHSEIIGVLEGERAALPFPGLSAVHAVVGDITASRDLIGCEHNPGPQQFDSLSQWFNERRFRAAEFALTRGVGAAVPTQAHLREGTAWTLSELLDFYAKTPLSLKVFIFITTFIQQLFQTLDQFII